MGKTKKKVSAKMMIRLNNKFYQEEAITEAANVFKEVCDCKVINGSFDIEITPLIRTEQDIAAEFSNYVLGLTKNKLLF